MTAEFFVDTNVLVYAYDRSEMAKRARARAVLDWLQSNEMGAVSTQVLGEFFRAVTRRLRRPLSLADGCDQLEKQLRAWRVALVTPQIVLEAARGSVDYQLPFWDAQVWATAKLNQIPIVLSEDFRHKSRIEGIEFLDPFKGAIPGEE